MKLQRRILLLIILSVLLPVLAGNYGRLVMETRTKLHIEEQRGGAALLGRFRVKDMRLAKGQWKRLRPARVLVQEVAEVCSRGVRGGDGEQHGRPLESDNSLTTSESIHSPQQVRPAFRMQTWRFSGGRQISAPGLPTWW